MPATTVKPHKFVKVLYGSLNRGTLGIEVDADKAIDVFTVPVSEFERWRSREQFTGSSFLGKRRVNFEVNTGPEFDGEWYLVLENPSDEPVEVDFDVVGTRTGSLR